MRRNARRTAARPLGCHRNIHALAAGIGRALHSRAPGVAPMRARPPMVLLATTLLLAGPLPAQAQTAWTGARSGDWFDPGNWTAGTPDAGDNVNIDTFTPNPAVVSGGDAFTDWLLVGQLGQGNLTITNGGTLTSVQSRIGNNAGVQGAVTVSGAGSTWNAGFDFLIGVDGSGSLTVADGGTVNSTGRSRLGFSAGAQGEVTVTGAGSTWNHSGDLVIGNAGDGNLAIEDGGTVTTGSVVLGGADGSLGSASVAGAGSSWTTGSLVAGQFGTGSVRVSDGGRLSSTFTVLGNGAGGGGGNIVTGVGSAWNTTGDLIVGNEGLGSLVITNGGTVDSAAAAVIGNNAGGQGSVSVLGAGSAWDVAGGLTVGAGGTGYFELLGGALVANSVNVGEAGSGVGSVTLRGDGSDATIGNALVIGDGGTGTLLIAGGGTLQAGSIVLGQEAGAQGTLTVSDAGSLLTHVGTTGEFAVGLGGTGTLTIDAGGVVDGATNATLGVGADSHGEATVSGAGSQWLVDGLITVGRSGDGVLSVLDGGRVEAIRLSLGTDQGGTGAATVSGSGSLVQLQGLDVGEGEGGSGSLVIENGGQVDTTVSAAIGAGASTGTMTVTGPGSTWNAGGTSWVGFNNVGSLEVLDGGVVNAAVASIGHAQDAQGALTVSGAGSRWLGSGALTVGNDATGTLTVENGGLVESSEGLIGNEAGGQGTASISGAGSAWNADGNVVVGYHGSGALTIAAGGTVDSLRGILGYLDAATGTATVTGAGSTWTIDDILQVGSGGTSGELLIADGGAVSSAFATIGEIGGTGTVTVTGTDSALAVDQWLHVGGAADGELLVADGGLVSSGSGVLGAQDGGTGTATIDGAGSAWNVGELVVGDAGAGTLSILGGATAQAGLVTAGADPGGQGSVLISGPGSLLSVTGDLMVGDGGTGSLDITGGARVETAQGWIGGRAGGTNTSGVGSVTVSGADSAWISTGFLSVGSRGAGSLLIEDGGRVESAGGVISDLGPSNGTVTVRDAGSSWIVAGDLFVGGAGGLTSPTRLDIASGGRVESESAIIGLYNGAGVTVSGAGSLWDNAGTLQLALNLGDGSTGGIPNADLTIADGGRVVSGAVELAGPTSRGIGTLNIGAAAGAAAVAPGFLDTPTVSFGTGSGTGILNFNHTATDYVFGAALTGTGTLNHLAGTTSLTGLGDASGTLNVDGGTLRVEGALGEMATTVASGATLGGSGSIAGDVTVRDGGILAPGSSAGTLTLGSLALSGGSILDYELGQAGVVGGGVNDLIEIDGDLTLDGTLDVTDIGGFGAGVYRLMDYGGTLTDNGLELGTLPAGSDAHDLFVQTAIGGQVNLVNSAGLVLSFWDGSVAGEHGNGTIDGGAGTWDADNDNWTADDGALNGRWDDGTFAVFGGDGGNVEVVGEQAVAGIQFMSGYTLAAGTDGALRIDGAGSVVRVDPGVTATIDAPITGAGGLVKTDTGTLVLSGDNSYAGGTRIDRGTLQVAGDANLGAASGALAFDGGTLRNTAAFDSARGVTLLSGGGTFETGADLTLSGTIDGDGALAKTGNGVLTLSGGNTYAGGTAVTGGVLSVSADANLGDASGALSLDGATLRNTAAFDSARGVTLLSGGGTFETGADLTLSGAIDGAGTLAKTGAGTLTLVGANTYAGGTAVLDGTLVGDVDAIRGDLANDGVVVFDQAIDAGFDGDITGSGTMAKRGAGALTLAGGSALDWNIEAGTLVAQAVRFGGDAGIADGAVFRFEDATGRYDGVLSGGGRFEIAGGDAPFMLGGNSIGFGGATFLDSGTLRVDGGLGGLTTIANGAVLTGTGVLGSVDNAGTLAPGNSIGTLHLSGDYTHREGAVLEAEIEPGGDSDLLEVAGSATIEGGTVQVVKLPGQYEGGTRYTLVDAAGGVDGTFDALDQDLPFLDLLLGYDANHVYLDVQRNDVGFDVVCGDGTFNQCQVAGALDRIGEGDAITPDLTTVLTEVTSLTLDQARAGFDRLSGEAHASMAGAMLEGHALYGRTVSRRLAERREAIGADRLQGGIWARGYGLGSDLDGDGNAHGANLELYGFAVGADAWATESWLVGMSLNTLRLDADFRPGDGGEADAKNVALYTSVQGERAYLDATASFAWWDSEITRLVEVGSLSRRADSKYGMDRIALALEAGLTYQLGTSTLQPLLSVEFSKLSTEGFREHGADDVDLVGRSQDVARAVAGPGLRWTGEYGVGAWTLAPTVQARWLHAFGDRSAEFDLAFAGAPDVGYRVRGVETPEDRGLVGIGLQVGRDALDVFADVDYQAGGGFRAASFGAGLRWRW